MPTGALASRPILFTECLPIKNKKIETAVFERNILYNKCKPFNDRTRKSVHFYQYWRHLIDKPQNHPQLIFADFDQPVRLKNKT
ncbi:hypothetical protein JOD14_000599 [Enterococcus lemanii]|nr:hypothetical protein [Enterococcus lemanii]